MGDIFGVVGMMLEPIRDVLYTYIGRKLGYLVHCKRNIKDFADEVDSLILVKARIQIKVETALNNAEVIHDDVKEWLSKVQSMEDVKTRLLQGKQNLKCVHVCSRYGLGEEGKETKPIVTKLIVDGNNFGTVGHQPPLTRAWHRTYTINYESFESRKLVFEEIIKALKDDRNYKIGIYGMPGVGKTRMMQEVAQQAENKRLFDQIAKIVVSQNPILKDIQLKLAASLNMKSDIETKDEDERRELLRIRLKNGKKILVMVDDVWNDQIKLEDIGIPAANDHTKGCKIILTSRRQDVCKEMGVPEKENFQIGVLSEAEAWSLFEKKVGDSFQTHEMHSVAQEVCRECAGLPLAILAVGGALKNKSKEVWKDALKQLINSMANNVGEIQTKLYSRIEWSYNYLEHVDAKKIFLLCCLFKEDAEISIDDLVRCGVGLRLLLGVDTMEDARNRVHAVVDTLKTSSLLLEGNKKDLVKMHDVIRDVAISIASKNEDAMYLVKAGVEKWLEEEEYKGRKAISLRLNKDCVLPNDSDCPELRTLMLEGSYPPSEVPNSFFYGMVKLEVLHFRAIRILTLPSSLKNVRMLSLYECKLVNLACLKEFKKLEILSIRDFALKQLPPEIGQLSRLRLLDLRGCYNLEIVPAGVISSLSELEELYLPHMFHQWEVKDLKRLISLEVHVPHVELLPLNELLIRSLIRFKISIGSKVNNEIRPSATKILNLEGFPLKRDLKILMEKAEVVYLFELEGLKDVFHDTYGEGFQELEFLKVEDCDEMEHLLGKPKWINSQSNQLHASGGSFSKLSELKVIKCPLMKYLFSAATARGLPQLQRLCIDNCEMLEEIVGDIEQEAVMDTITFNQLKIMELSRLPKLRSFYGNTKKMSTRGCNTSALAQALFNDKVRFPTLEELEIYDLKNLATTWDNELFLSSKGEDSFGRLRNINVRICHKLVNVVPPNALPLLHGLEILEVRECYSVVCGVEIVSPKEGGDEILVFSRLKTMRLEFLPNLKSFCWFRNRGEDRVLKGNNFLLQQQTLFSHKVAFPALEKLEIDGLGSLTAIWDDPLQSVFLQLQELNIKDCEMLEEIISDDQGVTMDIVSFHQLKKLQLYRLPNLRSFYVNLKKTSTKRCNTSTLMQALFNHKVAFPALEKLEIEEVGSLTAIWDDQLQLLLVKEAEDSFRRLMYMKVFQCEKLVNVIPSNMLPRLQNLEQLKVSKCDSVLYEVEVIGTVEKGYPTAAPIINVLPRLQEMELYDLPNLVMYIRLNRLCAYSNLTDLHLSNRDSLGNVFSPSTARYLLHLQKLTVQNCENMQEIVAIERGQLGEEDVVHDDDIIVFPQLKYLQLWTLPNLKSFCCCTRGSKKQEEETMEQKNISRVEALFNHKVRFPTLEELKIYDLKSLTTTWDNGLLVSSKGEDSFGRLRNINVQKCHKLVNVVPPNALGLEILVVEECDSVVCGVEMVAPEEGGDEILVFSRLKTMRLMFLPNFKSFCWSRSRGEDRVLKGNNIMLQQQTLFNHKVAFPALEKLEIEELGSLTAIWDDQMQLLLVKEAEDSFRQLMYMNVFQCEKLVNVIPSNMLPMLQKLEKLKVSKCDSVLYEVDVIGTVEKGYPTAAPIISVLPRLQEMELYDLPNLVMYIRLKRLCAYSNLTDLHLSNRDSLGNVFSPSTARYLVHLQKLKVQHCEKVQEIVAIERGQLGEEDVVHDDDIIVFPQLKYLQLWTLPNLKSFCCCTRGSKKQEEETMEQKNISRGEALFNHKVTFPDLEELEIRGLKSLTTIWDNQSFLGSGAQDSFRQLRLVNVKECEKLVRVLEESNIPQRQTLFNHKVKFPSSLTMKVYGCPKLEMFPCLYVNTVELETFDFPFQPFQKEKVELPILEKLVLGGGKIVEGTWHGHPSTGAFCKVRLLEVKNCRKLVNASNLLQWYEVVEELALIGCLSLEVVFKLEEHDAIERKAIVSSQIKNLTLICLPKLVHIWIMDPQGLLVFHKLTSLTVNNCHSLRYLLSFSIASLLTQLRVLVVINCRVIEEIVRSEGQGEEDAKGDIVFSQLVSLKLVHLPKFTSFCWANRAFKFPALEEVSLWGCPQLQTFTSGGLSTPLDIKVTGDDGLLRHVSDLNNYVQQGTSDG